MTRLLIHDPKNAQATAFGGLPVLPEGQVFVWPKCKSCKGHMQYLGRLFVDEQAGRAAHLIQLFMCQNDPGLCDEWEADAGGNAAIITGTERLAAIEAPSSGVTQLENAYGARIDDAPEVDYDEARGNWAKKTGQSQRAVLGQIGGSPAWIQADETPTCNVCGKGMRFVAQLEQGPDWKTEMNFGGGCAYVFECDCNANTAKMLWQC